MQHVDVYRQSGALQQALTLLHHQAARLADRWSRPIQIMEVCGGHTHSLFKYGIPALLPDTIELVHGPGCPVCVLPRSVIDTAVWLALQPDVVLASYGDAIRVPGSQGSLQQARAQGADVRVLYSALDALALAQAHPDKTVVFFAIGFETTMPGTALLLQQARAAGVTNLKVLLHHITIVPTLRALLSGGDVLIDGFIGPGHVSAIIGRSVYDCIAFEFGKPMVIAGFEPLDLVQAMVMLLQQWQDGRCEVENQYTRLVRDGGNRQAQRLFSEVFELDAKTAHWRGLGDIPHSGVSLTPAFRDFDVREYFAVPASWQADTVEGRCDQVVIGKEKPVQCPLFGNQCTPATPVGALMVSGEGACNAYYRYREYDGR